MQNESDIAGADTWMNKPLLKHRKLMNSLMCFLAVTFLCLALPSFVFSESYHFAGEGQMPTCTEDGYRVIEDQGNIWMEVIPASGHQFGEWIWNDDGTARTHTCQVCGYSETIRVSSVHESTFPRLDLYGSMEGIGKKTRVALDATYQDAEQSFSCYGLLTLQGHSTFGLPKKNYTIRFYDTPDGNKKHSVNFRTWKKEHKYILKANYADLSVSRNLVAARIWTSVVASRASVPAPLMKLPTLGAVDGFPITVYLNGQFHGLYTLNLHKDDDLFQMKDGKREALVICNAQTTDESLFRAPAAFLEDYSSDWEIEYCGTDDESWAKESFNDLITFIMESSDDDFKGHLQDYMDLDAAMDYLLFIYAMGLENSGAKDLVMLNYGSTWIPSAYDMEEAFGLDDRLAVYIPPEDFLPIYSDGQWSSGTGSLLWDRLLNAFHDELLLRYYELRSGPFSESSMLTIFQEYIAQIPDGYYDQDFYLYPDRPIPDLNMSQQIEQYILQRMPLLDHALEGSGNDEK